MVHHLDICEKESIIVSKKFRKGGVLNSITNRAHKRVMCAGWI